MTIWKNPKCLSAHVLCSSSFVVVGLVDYIYIYTSKGPTSSSCNPFWLDFHIQTDKLVKANQPDIVLVGQAEEDGRSNRCSNTEWKQGEACKAGNAPRAGRRTWENVEGESNSGPLSNQSALCRDPQARWVAPADPRSNIRDLSPGECSPSIINDTAQKPLTPRPLLEYPNLKDKLLARARKKCLNIHNLLSNCKMTAEFSVL